MTTAVSRVAPWSAIESEELNTQNWIQVAFKNMAEGHREYRVFGEVYGEPFSEHYYSDTDDTKRLAYDFYWEQLAKIEKVQTFLFQTFTIGDGDFTDVVCQECAEKFAKEHGLEWRGGHAYDSFTEAPEGSTAHAQCEPTWALGESDYPYSCCGYYLETSFTPEGVENLNEHPKWVQELYGY